MNERISELAAWATEYASERDMTGEYVIAFNQDMYNEKFAKLILTDVVETIKQSAGSHLMLNANEMEVKEIQSKVEGALAAMAAVSRRFKD